MEFFINIKNKMTCILIPIFPPFLFHGLQAKTTVIKKDRKAGTMQGLDSKGDYPELGPVVGRLRPLWFHTGDRSGWASRRSAGPR